MAQKRKTHQSKLEAAALRLKKLEERTAQAVKGHLGANWRDNLFEILMTRMDFAAPDKKILACIPSELCKDSKAIPEFIKLFFRTLRNILRLAKAPASPLHVALFGVLYASVIDVFLKDSTKDLSKTMAALDHRLNLFERAVDSIPCPSQRQADHRA